MLKYFIIFICFIYAQISVAQCHCGSSGSSCLNTISDGSLNNSEKFKLELSSEYRLFSQHEESGHSHGSHTHSNTTTVETTIRNMQMTQLSVTVNVLKKINFFGSIPYFNLTTSNHSHINSFGDAILGITYKPFKYNLFFIAGTKLPSGENINTVGDNLSLVGTGSIDPIGSIYYSLPLPKKINLTQQLFFRKSLNGFNKVNQGNIFTFQSSAYYNIISQTDSVGANTKFLKLGSGLWYENYGKQSINNIYNESSGGSAFLVPVTLQYYYKKWTGSLSYIQPVYQHYHGEQVNQLQRFKITFSKSF